MQLNVRTVSEMMKVTEATLTRWIRQRGLPAQQVAGQYRFNLVEVLDWAVAHQFKLENIAGDQWSGHKTAPGLADALNAGGVHYKVPGEDREAALRAVVGRLPLPQDFERESLLELFLAREALGSTAVGDGIAIPHARHPIVLPVTRPLATLCFLKKPIAYQAPDGKPVHILFSVICPTVAAHVGLLACLSRALHDEDFRQSVAEAKPREIILKEARRIEKDEPPADTPSPRAA
jgi:PTS system nitrogen regulatory IIA component